MPEPVHRQRLYATYSDCSSITVVNVKWKKLPEMDCLPFFLPLLWFFFLQLIFLPLLSSTVLLQLSFFPLPSFVFVLLPFAILLPNHWQSYHLKYDIIFNQNNDSIQDLHFSSQEIPRLSRYFLHFSCTQNKNHIDLLLHTSCDIKMKTIWSWNVLTCYICPNIQYWHFFSTWNWSTTKFCLEIIKFRVSMLT